MRYRRPPADRFISKESVDSLQQLHTVFNVAVASTVVAATELTIRWNKIEGVNSLSSAGQTIPFLIGVGAIARILYVYRVGPADDDVRQSLSPTDMTDLPVFDEVD